VAAAARRIPDGGGVRRSAGLIGPLVLVLALAGAGACRADDEPQWHFPTVDDTTAVDGQNYSYYYVPHLSELNQLVGYLFRSGLVRKDVPDREAAITRYSAYSCEGTLYVGAGAGPGAAEDINWSQVTALHSGPPSQPPSLIVERAPPADGASKPLVLYVPDPTIRYQLHQALAVLMSECRPRTDRGGTAAHDR
jgi:hypothetical protein